MLEALGVLPETESYSLILEVLSKYPGWISESAAAAARYLSKINNDLAMALFEFITNRPWLQGLKETKKAEAIFAISDSFSTVLRWLRMYQLDTYRGILAVISLCVVAILYMNRIVLEALLVMLFLITMSSIFRLLGLGSTTADKISRIDIMPTVLGGYVLLAVGMPYIQRFFTSDPVSIKVGGTVEAIMTFSAAILGIVSISPRLWIPSGFFRAIKGAIRPVFSALPILVPIYGVVLLLFYVLPINWKESVALLMAYVGPIISIIFFAIFACFGTKFLVGDIRKFKNYKKSFNPSRCIIASQFSSFDTGLVRKWYVDWLEQVSIDHIEAMRNLSNTWPDGKRPQIDGDTTTVQLAQLDARWLDLD